MILRILNWCLVVAFLSNCTEPVTRADNPRILLMGDSLLAIHGAAGRAVSNAIEDTLKEPVIDRAVSGARYFYNLPISGSAGLNIRRQFAEGEWDWIVLNGGGNDLLFGCGCGLCDRQMDRLISQDGRKGAIPGFVSKLRQTGAKVIYVGYLRTPGVTSPVEHCVNEGNEFDSRLSRLAKLDKGIFFLSNATLVPYGDRSFHGIDLVHPSVKGSRIIGQRVAEIIRR